MKAVVKIVMPGTNEVAQYEVEDVTQLYRDDGWLIIGGDWGSVAYPLGSVFSYCSWEEKVCLPRV